MFYAVSTYLFRQGERIQISVSRPNGSFSDLEGQNSALLNLGMSYADIGTGTSQNFR